MSTPPEILAEEGALLTPGEVAGCLRVSIQTVRRWINAGKLPAYKVGRAWRIKEADLQSWLKERRIAATTSDY
jgi:excisionase family DNA binding protein